MAAQLVHDRSGGINTARLGERLKACGDVDGVTEDVAIAHHDVAEGEPNPQPLPLALGNAGVSGSQAFLNFKRGEGCRDRTGELRQDSIPGRLDDSAVMTGDGRLDQLAHMRGEQRKRAFRVLADHAAVADNVGAHDSDEFAVGVGHCSCLVPTHAAPKPVAHGRAIMVDQFTPHRNCRLWRPHGQFAAPAAIPVAIGPKAG